MSNAEGILLISKLSLVAHFFPRLLRHSGGGISYKYVVQSPPAENIAYSIYTNVIGSVPALDGDLLSTALKLQGKTPL